jgi:feruloyl esterase
MQTKLGPIIDSNRTDLSAFRQRGGKILMWHGWTDTTLEPRNAINYYGKVIATTADRMAKAKGSAVDAALRADALADTQAFFRLFMAPGVNHCGGGLGPNSSFAYTMAATPGPDDPDHDIVAALDRWVVKGTAPDTLIASHSTAGVVDRTRPICAYPKLAKYVGQGDAADPRSFTCVDDQVGFARDMSDLIR